MISAEGVNIPTVSFSTAPNMNQLIVPHQHLSYCATILAQKWQMAPPEVTKGRLPTMVWRERDTSSPDVVKG